MTNLAYAWLMDDDELARIRERHGGWVIDAEPACDARPFPVFRAVRGAVTVIADDVRRLERALADAEAAR